MAERFFLVRGEKLAHERNQRALTQLELAAKIGISPSGIYKIERAKKARVMPTTFRRLAETWGMEITQLRGLIGYNEPANGHPISDQKPDDYWDHNIVPGSEVAVPEIPLFNLPLAAGDWMEVTELSEVSEKQMAHGLFRVRLEGDSMKPLWPNGTVVEFQCLRTHLDDVQAGLDYYVQRGDGYATFKRVEKIDEHAVTLRALNKKKYPKRMVVARQEVARMALAVGRIIFARKG